ncbi:uncharacterized protein PAF06_002019 isoform 1-T1 [Gastrophryne carolinensis]
MESHHLRRLKHYRRGSTLLEPLNVRIFQITSTGYKRRKHMLKSKEDSRRERSSNFQAFMRTALETLLGSCRRKRPARRTSTEQAQPAKTLLSWHRQTLPVRPFLLVRSSRGL